MCARAHALVIGSLIVAVVGFAIMVPALIFIERSHKDCPSPRHNSFSRLTN